MQNERYSGVSILLHWLIGIMIIAAFILGVYMTDLPDDYPGKYTQLYMIHKSVGVLIFGLVALRLLWRLSHATPVYPATMPAWQKAAAKGAVWGLYGLMFAIPLSGWAMSSAGGHPIRIFGLEALQLPMLLAKNPELAHDIAEVHELLAFVMMGLVGVHAAAALKHHFIDKDGVLRGMLPRCCGSCKRG